MESNARIATPFLCKKSMAAGIALNAKLPSKTSHILALSDYYFLYGSTITLSQFSDFLLLSKSKSKSASSFLISLNLPCSDSKKGRVYDLTSLIEK
jgi:hypothetical protein